MKTEKICSSCFIPQALKAFDKNKNSSDGLHSHCKKCRSLAAKIKYRAEYAEIIREARAPKDKTLKSGDVVRTFEGLTGVVNRTNENNINIFRKGESIGIWYNESELKKIGHVHSKGTRWKR